MRGKGGSEREGRCKENLSYKVARCVIKAIQNQMYNTLPVCQQWCRNVAGTMAQYPSRRLWNVVGGWVADPDLSTSPHSLSGHHQAPNMNTQSQ
jgi:hypothetical protein